MSETKTDKIIVCTLVLIAIVVISYAVIKIWNSSIKYMKDNTFNILETSNYR